jgi:hypothetical protein
VTYSFPSQVRQGGTRFGDLDTTEFHATYIQSVKQSDRFNWLLGADWQRIQASVPSGMPLPNTLQSASAVVGFDWFFRDRWRARLEVLPGVYSDFQDVSGDDFNAPFNLEVSYAFGPNLLVGGQLNVNARRGSPVLARGTCAGSLRPIGCFRFGFRGHGLSISLRRMSHCLPARISSAELLW